jgi:hypothetical protein
MNNPALTQIAHDELLVRRAGRMFHIFRQDTSEIAKSCGKTEAEVCRALEIYRARRRPHNHLERV